MSSGRGLPFIYRQHWPFIGVALILSNARHWRLAETSETLMGVAAQRPGRAGRMSAQQFRTFQDGRPDHERWELIAGVPMMMAPPTIAHNRIASNLERLLNDALASH